MFGGSEEKMRIIFDKLDINKDNSISPEEFEKMLQSWGKTKIE